MQEERLKDYVTAHFPSMTQAIPQNNANIEIPENIQKVEEKEAPCVYKQPNIEAIGMPNYDSIKTNPILNPISIIQNPYIRKELHMKKDSIFKEAALSTLKK